MGRQSLLTEERLNQIVNYLRQGAYAEDAAQASGISDVTYYNWLNRGKAEEQRQSQGLDPNPEEEKYLRFLRAIKTAQAEGAMRHVTNVVRAADDGNWQASAWMLERKNPGKWGRRDRTEHTGLEGGPVRIEVSTVDLEAKVLRLLAQRSEQDEE